MSGEFEAAGALATAGLVAGAVEGGEPVKAGDGACLNCGAKVEGRYCSNCGQATHANRKLFHLAEEFLHSLFHLDTKLWRTLPMVIFRPGTLTRNYVYGKRARYISPLALFLFTIFLMFFVFSFFESPIERAVNSAQERTTTAEELADARAALDEAEQELAAARAAPAPTDGTPPGLEVRLAEQAVSLARAEVGRREAALERARQQAAAAQADSVVQVDLTPDANAPAAAAGAAPAAGETPAPVEESRTWQDLMREAARSEEFVVVSGMPELSERIRSKFENPDLAVYRIQEAASKFSFLLAPLSLPFIMLLFLWKRGVTMYDHVVYALYALSFASVLIVAVMLSTMTPWTGWMAGWLIGLGLPVHTYFHMGGAYKLGWWSAFWRTCLMLLFATIVLSFFVVLIIILGLAG